MTSDGTGASAGAEHPADFETPDRVGAYPRLSADQLEVFARAGREVPMAEGDVLVKAGERSDAFLIVTAGRVRVADGEPQAVMGAGTPAARQAREDAEALRVEIHGPGRFLGDIGLLEDQPTFSTVQAIESGAVLVVPRPEVERILLNDPLIGDLVLRACLIRRSIAIGSGSGLRIVGSRFSPRTRELLDFAARNRLPHRLLDLDQDAHAEFLVRSVGISVDDLPVVILGGSRVLRNPSPPRLASELGMRSDAAPAKCEVLIVGAGPAGLAAAVYAASDGLSVVLTDAVATGGQAVTSARLENYLGFPAGISGAELAERATIQARKFGAAVRTAAAATRIAVEDGLLAVRFSDDSSVTARAVIVASGARYNRIPTLERLEVSSVFYAATVHEARTCGSAPVVVVGGGNSAGQAALFLAHTARAVHLVVRSGGLEASMSRYLIAQIVDHPGIVVHFNTELAEAHGESHLEGVVLEDRTTGTRLPVPARFVFVFIGSSPATEWVGPGIARDRDGYLITGSAADGMDRAVGTSALETSMAGVFAIGDVRSGSVKRVSAAIGEGASVVQFVHEYLQSRAEADTGKPWFRPGPH
jgi:thioredoxin reductase (NADPH)